MAGVALDPFDLLSAMDDQLVDWLCHVTAGSDAEKAQVAKVQALHGEVERSMDALVAHRLKATAAALPAEAARLDALGASIAAMERRIATAEQVINIAGQAVEIATRVLAFVA